MTQREFIRPSPQLQAAVGECGSIAENNLENTDPITSWLSNQWCASFVCIFKAANEKNMEITASVLDHIEMLSLMMERVGYPKSDLFVETAADIKSSFIKIIMADSNNIEPESETKH